MAVHPDGTWTVVEIKSFPMIDGSADAAKVGAAARQSAVYVLALERIAELTEGAEVGHRVLLVCPKDFSNLPAASVVDVRKQRAVTRRQLTRLARVEDIAAALPGGTTFDPGCPWSSSTPRSSRSARRTPRSAWRRANWPSTVGRRPGRRVRWRRWGAVCAVSSAG